MLKVGINPSFPLSSPFLARHLHNAFSHFLLYSILFLFSTSSLSLLLPPRPDLISLLPADTELLFGKCQPMIGSSVCSDFWWILSNNPAPVFVIVMKDKKKDSRVSSFSLIQFLVTHSRGNTIFFCIFSLRPLPNYSCVLLSRPHSPWRGSEAARLKRHKADITFACISYAAVFLCLR